MVTNSSSKTVDFDSIEGRFHGSLSNPLIGADLTVGVATKVNGGNITAFITGGSELTIAGNKAIFGVYDADSVNMVNIVYHSAGDLFLIQINSGFSQVIADTTAPLLVSAYVDVTSPSNIKLVFSEAVYGSNLGFSISILSILGVSGWGSSVLNVSLSGSVQYGDTPTISYLGGNVKDIANNSLANFSTLVVNDVAQVPDPVAIQSWIGAWLADTCQKDGSNMVTSWPDLTANGNNIGVHGSLQWVQNGIGGQPSIVLDGSNAYMSLSVFSQAPLSNVLLSDLTLYLVFQLDNSVGTGSYSTIAVLGGPTLASSGSNFMQVYVPNNGTAVKVNYPNTDADIDLSIGTGILNKHALVSRQGTGMGNKFTLDQNNEVSKTPIYNISLRNLVIGNFNGNGMKGKIAAVLLGPRLSDIGLGQLKAWTASKYGI